MSNVNVRRAVENIRANTTAYSPIVEVIVNAIQAIDETRRSDGKVIIRVQRSGQAEVDGSLPDVSGFAIEDNGVGFTDTHRNSFDTLYTDLKITEGGKGFGRFTCLKYFTSVLVESDYHDGNGVKRRTFRMGQDTEIIVNEKITASEKTDSGSVVTLGALRKDGAFDKTLATIGRNLVEKLLPYFITQDYDCPDIILSEADGSDPILLNDFVRNKLAAVVQEITIERTTFTRDSAVGKEEFRVRVFKFVFPRNQKSRISLVAHKREVSGSPIDKYVPEFEDEFYDRDSHGQEDRSRNYIVKAYVFGPYLDRHVSLERGGFEFKMESDLILGIAQTDIEREAATIAREAVGEDVTSRQEKKKDRVQAYVDHEAPWHKELLAKIDLSGLPYNATNEEIDARLHKERFVQEAAIKRDVAKLLAETDAATIRDSAIEIVNMISGTSKNELVHYIALRRKLLDIFGKSLEYNSSGSYVSEGVVHDIIFPRKGNTDTTSFENHNLWILDERLNFTTYVSSDVPLDGGSTERPDLLVYDKRVLFRGDNELSNPITIFEFKKPQRDDFVNPSSEEDPVQQIVRYVNNIRDGKYKTPEGRKILVAENTPFYGFVVCDLTQKVERWLEREKDFKPMPDRLGWFQWIGNINLYVEVISWDKVLRDAVMRNRVFFQKLGI